MHANLACARGDGEVEEVDFSGENIEFLIWGSEFEDFGVGFFDGWLAY